MKTTQHLLALLALLSIATICLLPLHAQAETREETRVKVFEKMRVNAEQGNAHAQFRMGRIYDEKYLFLGDADKDSDVDSRISLLEVKQDSALAVKWYIKAAEQGHAKAQARLGFCYSTGEGVELDYAVGMKWYRKAAEQGDANGQYMLGFIFAQGIGVQKDVVEAMKWFRKAAEQGNVSAQSEIDSRDDKGDLTPESKREGIEAMGKFLGENESKKGNGQIEFLMGGNYVTGEDVQKDPSEAVKWFRKAAEKGHADAKFMLAVAYMNGEGVVKNDSLAYQWFLLASANGNETARENVSKLEEKLTAEQRAEGQRLATEWQAAFEKRQAEAVK